ncbi:MAG TPA: type I restriction enzyme HsdR N-terminal domain-containing protein [bacterium]|nr:type I restriction enzyme HsdR N-terminal domain-containing protein [bacterium]
MAKNTRLRSNLKSWIPRLLQAQSDNLNEADTSARIAKVFEEVLGYDALEEIGRETEMKGKYVDLAIKLDGAIKILIEVKSAGVTLRDRHIEQAEGYASRNNYEWVLLTNGIVWTLYHLSFEEGIEYERVFSVDIGQCELDEACECFSLLSRDSIRKNLHEKHWEHQSALSPAQLGKSIFREDVLMYLRRIIRKQNGILVDLEDLANAIQGMLSTETRELMGPPRIRRQRRRTASEKADTSTAHAPSPANETASESRPSSQPG